MMKHVVACAIATFVLAVPLASGAIVSPLPRIPPYLPVPHGAAVVMNTGSTNTAGYRIVIERNGAASYVSGAERGSAKIPADLAAKFFGDLTAASPLQSLRHSACMKSASFGVGLFVWWNHERTPDLMCSADPRGQRLVDDASNIVRALHLSLVPRAVMRPMLPGEQHKALPSPSPAATY